jgi:hypothetical protein
MPPFIDGIAALVQEKITLFVALVAVYVNVVPLQIADGVRGEVKLGEGLTETFTVCVFEHPLVVIV